MTIGLALLMKNEADVLPATLGRIFPVIDAWTVMDTGSTDNSRELAQDLLGNLPGEVIQRTFDGFGPSRTALLGASREKADYTLMLDADHTLHVHGEKPDLNADSYLVKVEGSLEWRLPLLTSNAKPFEYRGAAHSYLACDQPFSRENTEWLSIDGGGGVSREKLERDRKLLEKEWLEQPDNARTAFYLAQSYRDLDLIPEAIRMYRLRAEMGGWDEEAYVARYELGCLLSAHVEFSQGADELLQAWRLRPSRAEALRALARAADAVADKIPKPGDVLFLHPSEYREQP